MRHMTVVQARTSWLRSRLVRCSRADRLPCHPARRSLVTESARTRIAAPPPLRTQARAALERARARAVASGALPEAATADDAPTVEIERPADPRHGDLASNLAMKLARSCRMAPLAIAGAVAAELEREIADDPKATPLAAVEVAPPGF